MKKLTKLIFSCAAVAAVTAAVGTAALASGVDNIVYTAGESNATVTFTYDATAITSDHTILIVPAGTTTVDDNTDIIHVDQKDGFAEVPVRLLANGTYEIRIGGQGLEAIKTGEFTVGDVVGDTVLMGDVIENDVVELDDAIETLKFSSDLVDLTDKQKFVGNVDGDGTVPDIADAICILKYASDIEDGVGVTGQYKTYSAE